MAIFSLFALLIFLLIQDATSTKQPEAKLTASDTVQTKWEMRLNAAAIERKQLKERLNAADIERKQLESRLTAADTELKRLVEKLSNSENTERKRELRLGAAETERHQLRVELDAMADKLVAVKERATPVNVAFHAGKPGQWNYGQGTYFTLIDVVLNQGNAFNASSGAFTAPVNGIYCFMATTGPPANERKAVGLEIMKGNTAVGYAKCQDAKTAEMATAHAVVHLNVGQSVWLRAMSDADYWFEGSWFSGFLVSMDP